MSPLRLSVSTAARLTRAALFTLLALPAASLPAAAAASHTHRTLPPEVQAAEVVPGGLVPGDTLPNFRLVDHTGRAHELYYEATRRVIVLVFIDPADRGALRQARALRRLRDRFPAASVAVWLVAPGQRVDRISLAATQTAYVLSDVPALHDGAQLVTTELGASFVGETFVLDAPSWTLAYRGPLDDADPANLLDTPRQALAEEAVASRLARTPVAAPRPAFREGSVRLDLPPPPLIDYASQIAPIVQQRCVSCHAPGGIAPRAFTRYEDLADRPGNLRQALLEQRMPPWDADARFDAFSPNAGLAPDEAARLLAWVRAGSPRGTAPDPIAAQPPPPVPDWPLGPPDSILNAPLQTLPATGQVAYRYLPVLAPQSRWLKAIVVRPGNRSVVHHALLFNGLEGLIASSGGLGGNFAGYVPGIEPRFFPEGTGKRVAAGDLFVLQMHYVTTGKVETDRTQIGLYYHPVNQPPARELKTLAAGATTFVIPPGAPEVPIEGTFRVERDSLLYELNPHLHYRGRYVGYEALYPDGRIETLLNVPTYDFDWQRDYRFALPKHLPAGTTLRVKGAWDNSPENLNNPNPLATVRWGEQTDDEMFIGYLTLADAPAAAAPNAAAPAWPGAQLAHGYEGLPLTARLSAQGTAVRYRVDRLPAGLALDPGSGLISGTPLAAGRTRLMAVAENDVGAVSIPLDVVILPRPNAPVILKQPASQRGRLGGTALFSAEVAAGPGTTYQWYKGGSDYCAAEGPSLALSNLTLTHAGTYRLIVSNAAGTVISETVTLSLDPPALINLSTRSTLAPGQRLIAGLTLTGAAPKRVLLRAVGPALATFGVPDAMVDPELAVFDSAGRQILANNDQGDLPASFDLATVTAGAGAFALPPAGRDAAMAATLPPGSYTLHLTSRDGRAGTALAEVYEADLGGTEVSNLSCRLRLTATAPTLITGFVVGGETARPILIRAAGPALAAFGVPGVLARPRLSVYRSDGTRVIQVSGWTDTPELRSAVAATGAFGFATGSADAATVLTLAPGGYTVHVEGGEGETLVEVYRVP